VEQQAPESQPTHGVGDDIDPLGSGLDHHVVHRLSKLLSVGHIAPVRIGEPHDSHLRLTPSSLEKTIAKQI
jgi:hypothetical protein